MGDGLCEFYFWRELQGEFLGFISKCTFLKSGNTSGLFMYFFPCFFLHLFIKEYILMPSKERGGQENLRDILLSFLNRRISI